MCLSYVIDMKICWRQGATELHSNFASGMSNPHLGTSASVVSTWDPYIPMFIPRPENDPYPSLSASVWNNLLPAFLGVFIRWPSEPTSADRTFGEASKCIGSSSMRASTKGHQFPGDFFYPGRHRLQSILQSQQKGGDHRRSRRRAKKQRFARTQCRTKRQYLGDLQPFRGKIGVYVQNGPV